MELNIDRLHQTIRKSHTENFSRREGKTTGFVVEMLGELELGGPQNTYLYLTSTHQAALYTQKIFVDMLYEMEFPMVFVHIKRDMVYYEVTQNYFLFRSIDSLGVHDVYGVQLADVYFDIWPEQYFKYEELIGVLRNRCVHSQ